MSDFNWLNFGSRRFAVADQEWFAAFSGDHNPMHVDALQARRTQAGAPVVHGVHTALWALDLLYGRGLQLPAPKTLSVRFDRFIYLDEEVQVVAGPASGGRIDLTITVEGMRAALVSVGIEPRPARPVQVARRSPAPPGPPVELEAQEIASAQGSFALEQPDSVAADAFPFLAEVVGARAVNGLAALSTLVGMHCPGLHSLFSKFNIVFTGEESGEAVLDYRTARFQPILRLATIDVTAPALAGNVEAFLRQPPIRQPSIAELAGRMPAEALAGARVLVIGGSRGLGELTAKLAALAGAEVTITYASGARDAEAVAEEIRSAGLDCTTSPLDVRQPLADQLADASQFTHIYYFATPPIFRKHSDIYAHDAFLDFLEVYVRAFAQLCIWANGAGKPVGLFYPSSVAVEELPKGAAEYSMAKAAGELLCQELARGLRFVDILVERLPRLATDQTSTVLPVKCSDALEVMLPIMRKVHGLAGG